jgi:hypothetical protein
MHEVFTSPFALSGVIVPVCVAVIAVGCTFAVQWRKAREAEVAAALKKEMIEREMSVDDIVRVLAASPEPSDETSAVKLAEQGMSADDIVKILQQREKMIS